MRSNLALLAFLFCVIAFTSCSIEKRIYENGYHISWLHPKPTGPLADVSQDLPQDLSENLSENLETDVSQGCSKGASQDLPKDLSQNLETGASQDLSKNLSKNLQFKTPSDTITPTTKEDDYFGQKETNLPNENKEAFFGPPISKPKTVEQLKKAIGRDFKLVLLAMIIGGFSGGILALIGQSATGVSDGYVFLLILFFLSIAGFIFYLVRGLLRILKLTVLKIFGKKDDAAINKRETQHRIRESEHQYLRRFGLWFGQNLFSPIGRLKILGLLLLIAIPLLVIFNPH
jgi:hypothetical protein